MSITEPVLSSVQLAVIGSALESICDEMGEALIKASYSPNIKERRDCTTALFDVHGNTLSQAEHIPIHLGSLMGIVEAVLKRYPIDDIHEGDSFIGNDPFTGGGTHLPDIVLVSPIFFDNEIKGWATNLAHHSDFANRGHDHIFQEGLRIPVTRFMRNGKYIDDILNMILTNMQVPEERIADFNAQVAANRLGIQRYQDICRRYGPRAVDAAGRELMDYTERKVRAGIREIPDGTYSFRDVFDESRLEGTLDLSLVITVADSELSFSFDAPPQVNKGLNVVYSALLATVYYAVKTLLASDIPTNAGLYRPIRVSAPLGSVLNCVAPAAVHSRTQLCQRVVDLVHGALAEALPERVIAACNGAVSSTQFSGIDPRSGKFYVYVESTGGGYGAGLCEDGLDGVQAHITNTSNLPVEALESEYPLTVLNYELVNGSGGPGEHRGGMGILRRLRIEHDDCHCEVGASRVSTQPWGLFGGLPGAPSSIMRNDQVITELFFPATGKGDTVTLSTAGGGGYGPPAKRPASAVRADIREQRISRRAALDVYGPELVGDEGLHV